jgi:hypothetical protein
MFSIGLNAERQAGVPLQVQRQNYEAFIGSRRDLRPLFSKDHFEGQSNKRIDVNAEK